MGELTPVSSSLDVSGVHAVPHATGAASGTPVTSVPEESDFVESSEIYDEDTSQTDGFVKQIVDYKLEQIRKTWGRLKGFFYSEE